MKKTILSISLFAGLLLISLVHSNAQCVWKQKLYDGFEYQTPCPDLIPGTTVHVVPQTFAVHSGTYSLYMNFINCNGTTGTCPGDTVYKRTLSVCQNVPFRISSWFATSFSGTQCDINVVVVDANNLVLANTSNLLAPYAPTWFQYQTGTLTATTSTVSFIVITNVGGSQTGNDLSMDDFSLEQCQDLNLGPDTIICNTNSMVIDAGPGYTSYQWNTGASTQSINTPLGWSGQVSYNVTVTNGNGCTFRDTIKVTFTVCTSVDEKEKDNSISIYPNPAKDKFEISGLPTNKKNEIKIFDAIGQKVFSTVTTNGSLKIKTESFKTGIYFLQVKTNSSVQTTKLCIKH